MAGELVVSTINGAGFDGGNVIINPEFTLNQRGAASRTAATGYNFDRWYYDGTRLLQGVEGNNLRAGTYVLSWEGSSTAEFSLNTAAASGQGSESYTAVTNGGTITIASVGSNNLWVRFSSDLTNLTRVKLSPGTEASGFVARPHGTELALCQRYACSTFPQGTAWGQNRGTSGAISVMSQSTSARQLAYFTFPVTMRATPTVTTYSPSQNNAEWWNDSLSITAGPATLIAAAGDSGRGVFTTNNASGLSHVYLIHLSASAEL
jgi:hypothetical protein